MKYNNYGEVIGNKRGTDFYIIKSFGEYHIIESSDELKIEDIISWDDFGISFYDESQKFKISALFQWENLTYQQAVNILATQC